MLQILFSLYDDITMIVSDGECLARDDGRHDASGEIILSTPSPRALRQQDVYFSFRLIDGCHLHVSPDSFEHLSQTSLGISRYKHLMAAEFGTR